MYTSAARHKQPSPADVERCGSSASSKHMKMSAMEESNETDSTMARKLSPRELALTRHRAYGKISSSFSCIGRVVGVENEGRQEGEDTGKRVTFSPSISVDNDEESEIKDSIIWCNMIICKKMKERLEHDARQEENIHFAATDEEFRDQVHSEEAHDGIDESDSEDDETMDLRMWRTLILCKRVKERMDYQEEMRHRDEAELELASIKETIDHDRNRDVKITFLDPTKELVLRKEPEQLSFQDIKDIVDDRQTAEESLNYTSRRKGDETHKRHSVRFDMVPSLSQDTRIIDAARSRDPGHIRTRMEPRVAESQTIDWLDQMELWLYGSLDETFTYNDTFEDADELFEA